MRLTHTLAIGHSALSDARGWPSPSDSKKAPKDASCVPLPYARPCLRIAIIILVIAPSSPQPLTRHCTHNRAHHLPPTIRSSDHSPSCKHPRHPAALSFLCRPPLPRTTKPSREKAPSNCIRPTPLQPSVRKLLFPSESASSPGAFGSSRMNPSSSSSSSRVVLLPSLSPHSPCVHPCICRLPSAASALPSLSVSHCMHSVHHPTVHLSSEKPRA